MCPSDVGATVNHDPEIGYLLMVWVLQLKIHVLDKFEFDEPEYNLLVQRSIVEFLSNLRPEIDFWMRLKQSYQECTMLGI